MITLPSGPNTTSDKKHWGQLNGTSLGLVLSESIRRWQRPICIVTRTMQQVDQLYDTLQFFLGSDAPPMWRFPDWETLPYDAFSPHQDIVSERLMIIRQLLLQPQQAVVIVPVRALQNRLAPPNFLVGHCLSCRVGDHFDLPSYRRLLEQAGYHCVSQVITRGEFAVRGSIIDIFPMGVDQPYRIDLFDDEIDSIRTFDIDSQRSADEVNAIDLLPAHEFPLEKPACEYFVKQWQTHFPERTWQSPLLTAVKQQRAAAGLEYYLPLFFDTTVSFADYLPDNTVIFRVDDIYQASQAAWQDIESRYQTLQYDLDRPALSPAHAFIPPDALQTVLNRFAQVQTQTAPLSKTHAGRVNFNFTALPDISIQAHTSRPLRQFENFLQQQSARVLLVAESAGRREILNEHLQRIHLNAKRYDNWQEFVTDSAPLGICLGRLSHGLLLPEQDIAVVAEQDLFHNKIPQQRRRKAGTVEAEQRPVFKDLSELQIGDAVVHLEHGIGRYLGLTTLTVGNQEDEFLTLEYAKKDKLYVPVHNLHLISRYSSADMAHAPLNQLGTDQWNKAKQKAAKRIHDVAAELLEIHAKRAAKSGFAYHTPDEQYRQFADGFPFEETPDQVTAINAVISDMLRPQPMDRLLCGDVGFGKTEVAMRAAFIAVQNGKQVGILVPTTLLAQQHYQNFVDRFADWPVEIAELSRFRSGKQQQKTLTRLAAGKVDIVIGTHKLLSGAVQFKNLGLVIIDEEHRFGVRQKERLKALRTEVDILTMTATPIPRTLNMALADIRDLSIIATPPARRLAVNTFVREYRNDTIKEAVLREVLRGGQVYFLHNDVKTIVHQHELLQNLLPDIAIGIAHGQMRERELEKVMADFYHNRYQILLCSTIIETGIDIPNANTIIINRADKLGLAQLHQLRGRVGRSHHQAYAYLLTPEWQTLTQDAQKRLEAIQAASELGAGYTLASHDLEIRGAGELLGEEQSGNMQSIGYSLYMELLDKTVAALQQGKDLDADTLLRPQDKTEIDLSLSSIIPEDYLPDVHMRLSFYKRISQAKDARELDDVQVEMIDRFGLLPAPARHLFAAMHMKFIAEPLGIRKVKAHANGGKITFAEQPNIDPATIIRLVQVAPQLYQLAGPQNLQFTDDLQEPKKRITFINELLAKLAKRNA